jgi:hypothetical protein
MGTLSMPASDLHTKDHRPPERSSDLLGDTVDELPVSLLPRLNGVETTLL